MYIINKAGLPALKLSNLISVDSNLVNIGETILKITFKPVKVTGKPDIPAKISKGAIMLAVTDNELDSLLSEPVTRTWLKNELLKIQKGLITNELDNKSYKEANGISLELFNQGALLDWIKKSVSSERANGTRLSGKSITEFFNQVIEPVLSWKFSEMLNVSLEHKKVVNQVGKYRDNMTSLAGNTLLSDDMLGMLLKSLDMVAESNNPMLGKLLERINSMQEVGNDDDMLSLD